MADFGTDAILLRKIEYGDHDYIISFLTQDHGRITVIAKNAKQSVRRFTGALDLFSFNHIQCKRPKKKKDALTILFQADLENGFGNIRSNVFSTAYASFWSELVYFWLEEEKPVAGVYELLLFCLKALDEASIDMQVLNLFFQIRFISISGFTPNIEICDACQTPVDQIRQKYICFDFKEGRIMCERCAPKNSHHSMNVSKGTLKQLFWINNSDFGRTDRIRFSRFAIKEGQALLEAFIPFHLGRDFNSLKFLNRLRQEI